MGRLVARSDAIALKRKGGHLPEPSSWRPSGSKQLPKKHADVLMHMMGFFKKELSTEEKQELLEVIDHYKQGLIPLIVPVTLLLHYVRKYNQPYLKNQ